MILRAKITANAAGGVSEMFDIYKPADLQNLVRAAAAWASAAVKRVPLFGRAPRATCTIEFSWIGDGAPANAAGKQAPAGKRRPAKRGK